MEMSRRYLKWFKMGIGLVRMDGIILLKMERSILFCLFFLKSLFVVDS